MLRMHAKRSRNSHPANHRSLMIRPVVVIAAARNGGRLLSRLVEGRVVLSVMLSLLAVAGFALGQNGKMTDTGYRWPVDEKVFTSTFAEYRPSRFHAGLDFSTGGVTGRPCYAIADGHISRIKVNFSGYGRVIYLQLKDGNIVVYAHLDRFTDEVEAYIRKEQRRSGGYEIERFLGPDTFPFKQGDIVAYTGDTGAGPAHLHFEMRKGMITAFDPVLAGFVVPDDTPPSIKQVVLAPLDGASEVQGDLFPVLQNVVNGKVDTLSFQGRAGVSVYAVDYQTGYRYRLGLRRLELYVDGVLRHATTLDSFPYGINRHARMEFDFEMERRGEKRLRRMYHLPPNRLPFYDDSLPGGVLDSDELGAGPHTLEIRATDMCGNRSSFTWTVYALPGATLPPLSGNGPPPLMPNRLSDRNMTLKVDVVKDVARVEVSGAPAGGDAALLCIEPFDLSFHLQPKGNGRFLGRAALPKNAVEDIVFKVGIFAHDSLIAATSQACLLATKDANTSLKFFSPDSLLEVYIEGGDTWFDLASILTILPPEDSTITPVYRLRPGDHPFANSFDLVFHSDQMGWDQQALILFREDGGNGRWHSLGRICENDGHELLARALSFEDFAVGRDTTAPSIDNVSPRNGIILTNRQPMLQARINDDLAGVDINHSSLKINGEEVIWVYDPDKRKIYYEPWEPLTPGDYTWTVVVEDGVGNKSIETRRFTVQ